MHLPSNEKIKLWRSNEVGRMEGIREQKEKGGGGREEGEEERQERKR